MGMSDWGSKMASTSGTVVVVEDDPNIADLIELYLRRDGHRVIHVSDGEAGLETVARERTRLIILDVGLPGPVDRFELCRRVRSTSSVPVIMLTARGDEIDRWASSWGQTITSPSRSRRGSWRPGSRRSFAVRTARRRRSRPCWWLGGGG
jgi:CheY-like chemotaxis protein